MTIYCAALLWFKWKPSAGLSKKETEYAMMLCYMKVRQVLTGSFQKVARACHSTPHLSACLSVNTVGRCLQTQAGHLTLCGATHLTPSNLITSSLNAKEGQFPDQTAPQPPGARFHLLHPLFCWIFVANNLALMNANSKVFLLFFPGRTWLTVWPNNDRKKDQRPCLKYHD